MKVKIGALILIMFTSATQAKVDNQLLAYYLTRSKCNVGLLSHEPLVKNAEVLAQIALQSSIVDITTENTKIESRKCGGGDLGLCSTFYFDAIVSFQNLNKETVRVTVRGCSTSERTL